MYEVMKRVHEHYYEALDYFPQDDIVGIFLQGSQNYGLATHNSDVDTKLVVLPTLGDIILAKKPVSTTHIRDNDEHIDFKDIRLMFKTFRKQNINFIEILFTDYFILNPKYKDSWEDLVYFREEIAHYNVYNTVKAMKGMAMEKFHAMEHRYPAKAEVIDMFGYDPKQLHHLLRLEDFLTRYISGERYEDCLKPKAPDYLIEVKAGYYDLEAARVVAKKTMDSIEEKCAPYTKDSNYNVNNENIDWLLDNILHDIVKCGMSKYF